MGKRGRKWNGAKWPVTCKTYIQCSTVKNYEKSNDPVLRNHNERKHVHKAQRLQIENKMNTFIPNEHERVEIHTKILRNTKVSKFI